MLILDLLVNEHVPRTDPTLEERPFRSVLAVLCTVFWLVNTAKTKMCYPRSNL